MSGTARRELFGLRFQPRDRPSSDNTAGLARAKREVARALTIRRERTIDTGQAQENAEEENIENTKETPAVRTRLRAANHPRGGSHPRRQAGPEDPRRPAEAPREAGPAARRRAGRRSSRPRSAAGAHARRKAAKVSRAVPAPAEERHTERVAERPPEGGVRRGGRVKARAKASHATSEPTPPRERCSRCAEVRQGIVVSDKADKTIHGADRHCPAPSPLPRRSCAPHGRACARREQRRPASRHRDRAWSAPLSRTKRWRLVK